MNSDGMACYPLAIDTSIGISYWGIANPTLWSGAKDFPMVSVVLVLI